MELSKENIAPFLTVTKKYYSNMSDKYLRQKKPLKISQRVPVGKLLGNYQLYIGTETNIDLKVLHAWTSELLELLPEDGNYFLYIEDPYDSIIDTVEVVWQREETEDEMQIRRELYNERLAAKREEKAKKLEAERKEYERLKSKFEK